LYPPIAQFLQEQAFPRGSVHLRTIDLVQEIFGDVAGARVHKLAAIGLLLSDFPKRRFVLVGDSGEQDPEIYGELAREHRGRIVAVIIRNVTGEGADAPRYAQAMRDLPRKVWAVFDDPVQLPRRGL
jgi:phosphatidate phosphatase APP1